MLQAAQWQAPAAEPQSTAPVATHDLPTGSLDQALAKQLFARYGIPCAREVIVQSGAVVLKILSKEITHRAMSAVWP
jgi:hypothetical protein